MRSIQVKTARPRSTKPSQKSRVHVEDSSSEVAANLSVKPAGTAGNPPSAGYQVTQQVGHQLRRAYQRHVSIFQQGIPDSQLTMPQFVALCTIRDLGSCSLNEIVAQTFIDQATIRGVVDRLSSRKLIDVGEDPSDRRKLAVSLTPAGAQLLEQVIGVAQDITEQTLGSLNEAERIALVYLLEKMCAST
ncbi:MarR family transcriptional regulator [Variovorax guangxiensis]|uniref:MarR family transcriptional regulator n=1 Tax=Variovorax guangxiensis TaxID=1775474 RepID=A0A433MTV5_9BURK|nr:MarR family winged helix-turn-helix transcriptional regulator [Variovorax guangxiensis]RUR71224.1 MarR family transcriptional regulator [Variovorax guangxiensis]